MKLLLLSDVVISDGGYRLLWKRSRFDYSTPFNLFSQEIYGLLLHLGFAVLPRFHGLCKQVFKQALTLLSWKQPS